MSKYIYISELDDTDEPDSKRYKIIELNRIISVYNNWQLEDACNLATVDRVIRYLEYGRQTLSSADQEFSRLLEKMERFVESKLKEQNGQELR